MNVLIAGAGAVGGFLAVRLDRAGRNVSVLVRPARAERLRERGVRLVAGIGATTTLLGGAAGEIAAAAGRGGPPASAAQLIG